MNARPLIQSIPVSLNPKTTQNLPGKGNVDGSLEGIIGTIYFRMNAGNVLKNIIGAGACAAALSGAAKIAAGATFAVTGLTTLIGLFYVGTGVVGIKEALNGASQATEARKKAIENDTLIDDEKIKHVSLFKFKEFSARLGVCGWALYIGIGVSQLGAGIVTLLGPETAQALHTTAVITGNVVIGLLSALLTGLGIAYIARGSLMLYRSYHGIEQARALREGLKKTVNNEEFKQLTPQQQKDAIKHFLEVNAALNLDETRDIYTTLDKYSFDKINTQEEVDQYIQALDEGFHDELSRQKVARTIGASMILGGVLTLVAAYLSGGTSILLVSLISSIIFTVMEGSFLLFDSIPHFESYAHKNYSQPVYLKNKGTLIYELDKKTFNQYQSALRGIKPLNESEETTPLLKKPIIENPKLTWLELAWSPLYPDTLYKKYQEKSKVSSGN